VAQQSAMVAIPKHPATHKNSRVDPLKA